MAPSQTLEKSLKERIEIRKSPPKSEISQKSSRKSKNSSNSEKVKTRQSFTAIATEEIDDKKENTTTTTTRGQDDSKKLIDAQSLSITDEEKRQLLTDGGGALESGSRERSFFRLESRPFLQALFEALECNDNDYLALFALCLIYAIQQNTG